MPLKQLIFGWKDKKDNKSCNKYCIIPVYCLNTEIVRFYCVYCYQKKIDDMKKNLYSTSIKPNKFLLPSDLVRAYFTFYDDDSREITRNYQYATYKCWDCDKNLYTNFITRITSNSQFCCKRSLRNIAPDIKYTVYYVKTYNTYQCDCCSIKYRIISKKIRELPSDEIYQRDIFYNQTSNEKMTLYTLLRFDI